MYPQQNQSIRKHREMLRQQYKNSSGMYIVEKRPPKDKQKVLLYIFIFGFILVTSIVLYNLIPKLQICLPYIVVYTIFYICFFLPIAIIAYQSVIKIGFVTMHSNSIEIKHPNVHRTFEVAGLHTLTFFLNEDGSDTSDFIPFNMPFGKDNILKIQEGNTLLQFEVLIRNRKERTLLEKRFAQWRKLNEYAQLINQIPVDTDYD